MIRNSRELKFVSSYCRDFLLQLIVYTYKQSNKMVFAYLFR